MTQATLKSVQDFHLQDLQGVTRLPPEAAATLGAILSHSAIWTGRVNGRVVAICGVTTLYGHHGEAWSYLHTSALPYKYWLHREVSRILHRYVREANLWRVQAVADTANQAAGRWLEHLGFVLESVMPLYGPQGETMTRYVLFPRGVHG